MASLRKIQVSTGIHWVEAPEADVRILCGCPADTVKHLMKRGLIVPTESEGVAFETGPNAILLSDVMVQNGEFSNMAEFPVLQMLYRQGMFLPGHPNNTGTKPLIMGLKDQVLAQMKYIYRGNYGLVSEKEIMEAGATEERAAEIMRMKLKFAFGSIRETEDFIDPLVIGDKPVEIRNGVTVRRLRMNVFEFSHGEDSVTVDLSLSSLERYASPYPLGHHDIKREYFAVIHSGEGDGWDVDRPSMSSIIMYHGKIYLIDAGPNIVNTLNALGIGINEIEGIFHTHSHDDHFAGLTTLIRVDHRIKYYATPLVQASVAKKLAALLSMDEKNFADYFDVHELVFDEWNNIEGLEVRPILSPHPVETSIFMFRTLWESGYRSYAHFADIASFDVLKGMVTADQKAPGISQEFHDRVIADYQRVADIKKLDIGGGMIHGRAEDFSGDGSAKLVLSHTAFPLTDQQKEIGSGAPFGTIDILIRSYQDFALRYGFEYLRSYFPDAPVHQLRILLNNRVYTFNPETILLKEGDENEDIFLILSGSVEIIQSDLGVRRNLYGGTLVGEISGLYKLPSTQTYRAVSFVRALRIPASLYSEFVGLNNLYREIERLQEHREFLQRTWLLGEALSHSVQNKIAMEMAAFSFPEGQIFPNDDKEHIFFVLSGAVERFIGETVFETMASGDFFGEEAAIFDSPGLYRIRAVEAVEIYRVPAAPLRQIPIARWKLFETFEKRKHLVLNKDQSGQPAFRWRREYGIEVPSMDAHHQKLFEFGGSLFEAVESKKGPAAANKAVNFLIEYTRFHFTEEEALMKKHHYPGYEAHCEMHKRLVEQIVDFKTQLEKNNYVFDLDFADFFEKWLLNHVLSEDRKYAAFIRDKVV